MKKWMLLGFMFLFLSSLVLAQIDNPSASMGGDDAEKLQEAIDTYIPIGGDGKFDDSGFKEVQSKAEVRIEKINLWLEENASWLSLVFGMVPAISWLFAWNFYFILFFFVILFLNGEVLFSFFSESKSKLIGLIIFIVLLVLKFYLILAKIALDLMNVIWNIILPWGTAIAIILGIILILGGVASIPIAIRILKGIEMWLEARREKKAKEKTDEDREVLNVQVKEMEKK